MTITQLETFLRIARTGSFTSAASSLGYAQSTVTTQIKQLEDELGTALFDRLGRTVILTPAGERLITYADRLLQIEREIHLSVPDTEEPAGVLKAGVSESLCYSVLPDILMRFKAGYPKIEVRVQFVTHDTFPVLLKTGELDIVYTINPLIEDSSLRRLALKEEEIGFFVCPSHPLARKSKVTELDLAGIPLLLTGHDCSFRHMLISDLEASSVPYNIALETSSKEVLKQFAAKGFGVAFIPDITAEKEVRDGSLVKLRWGGGDFRIYSQIFVHKDKHLSRAMNDLAEMICDGKTQ